MRRRFGDEKSRLEVLNGQFRRTEESWVETTSPGIAHNKAETLSTARLDAENAHHRAAMIASDLAASLASAGAYR